jgi:flagellar hook-associated protein 3 FlgL
MRVDPDRYDSINAAIQQSEQQLQSAMNQLSSGRRVSIPSDDPQAFAENLRLQATAANVDTFTRNADTVISQAQMADSALSSVTAALTQVISLGTEAGNGVTSSQRDSLVEQVEAFRSQVIAQANATSHGQALFAGTSGATTPFVEDPNSATGVTYQGNSETNQAQVGNAISVSVNLPGDDVFLNSSGSVLGSLQQMITAIQSGDPTELADANAAVTAAIGHVSQVRGTYGTTVDELNAQNSFLSQESISLTTQQTSLVDVDTATAATNLAQAETQNSAVLAAAAKVLPQSLLQYLHG